MNIDTKTPECAFQASFIQIFVAGTSIRLLQAPREIMDYDKDISLRLNVQLEASGGRFYN